MLGCSVANSSLPRVFVRLARHRQIAEPEVVAESSEDSDEGTWHPEREESSEDEEEEEEEVDDEVAVSSLLLCSDCRGVLSLFVFRKVLNVNLTPRRKLREDEP